MAWMPVTLGACTMVGGAPDPPAPTAVVPGVRATGGNADTEGRTVDLDGNPRAERITKRVVDIALASIGTPYLWGGSDANGFDCSGLIRFAYREAGIRLPRTSSAQMRAGMRVQADPALLRVGDILGFSADRPGRTDHVGLYVGAGDFIHSSSSGVRVSSLHDRYWRAKLVAVRRVVD